MAFNALGAVTTGVVTAVMAVSKFWYGAWIVLLLVPLMVAYFLWVHRQYDDVAETLQMPPDVRTEFEQSAAGHHNHAVVLVGTIDRRIVPALKYADYIHADAVEAVFVDATGDRAQAMRAGWEELGCTIPLTIIESPYREIIEPIREYVHSIPRPEDGLITVIIPQFVPADWAADYGGLYVSRPGLRFWIKRNLFFEPNVVVVDVPYRLRPGEEQVGAAHATHDQREQPPAAGRG